MIDVEETADGLRAIDVAKNEVDIEIDGWVPGGEEFDIDRRVHQTMSGTVREVRFPQSAVTIEDRASHSSWRFGITDERIAIEWGKYLIQAENSMMVYIRTNAEFELRNNYQDDETIITFPERTELTFGFRSHEKRPDDQIKIPPTPEGLASAISAMGQYHDTETPDRSYPSMRLHPPLVDVDKNSQPNRPSFDSMPPVRFEAPRSLKDLFVIAPLVYYMSAEVVITDRPRPSIVAGNEQIQPSNDTPVHEWAGSLLRRVFYLDCLVRNTGPYEVDIAEMALLDEISIDAAEVYELTIDNRLVEYMDVDFDNIEDSFPTWPLTVFVEPSLSNISTIPHLLNKLALIHPPESELMDRKELISRSLDDFERHRGIVSPRQDNDQLCIHVPQRSRSVSQGWIADGAIADGFKCSPDSFSNGLTGRCETSSEISVLIILNEGDMDAELANVDQTYRRLRENLPLSVQVHSCLTKKELRDVFESSNDYVHYIGHCDDAGLRCSDGHLNAEHLRESRVRMFFLNACGSYQQGLSLIQKGSTAGTVTTSDVIDSQARRVGVTLAKLLMHGFSVDRSVDLARRQAIMNRQYIVIGDGTKSLIQGISTTPTIAIVEQTRGGSYSIKYEQDRLDVQGALFKPIHGSGPVLIGNRDESLITEKTLFKILNQNQGPVIYEDTLYWPDELLEELF